MVTPDKPAHLAPSAPGFAHGICHFMENTVAREASRLLHAAAHNGRKWICRNPLIKGEGTVGFQFDF